MLLETSCDAVMIGRGLLGNPWLIKNSLLYLEGKEYNNPSSIDKIEMCKKHLNYLLEFKSPKLASLEIRNHIGWYLKGIPSATNVKNKIYQTNNISDILDILNSFEEEVK
jgi:tRNA-dihydrouridine synthase B